MDSEAVLQWRIQATTGEARLIKTIVSHLFYFIMMLNVRLCSCLFKTID